MVFISGQIGMRPDGTVPPSIGEQAEQVFSNISALLAAHHLGPEALVKLTAFIVAGQDVQAVRQVRTGFLKGHRPTSTIVYVSQLVEPGWHVEIEAVAARSAS